MSLVARVLGLAPRALSLAAFLVPFAAATMHLGTSPLWRDDVAVTRAFGGYVSPGALATSTLAHQVARLLPVGPPLFRLGVVSALALGLASLALYRLACRSLGSVVSSRAAPWLSFVAACTAALTPLMLAEATVAGGATVAVALGLWTLAAVEPLELQRPGPYVAAGTLLALLAAENPVAAVVVALALVASFALTRIEPHARWHAGLATGAALPVAVVLVGAFARRLAAGSSIDLALSHGLPELSTLDVAARGSRGIVAWISDAGILAFLASILGAGVGLVHPRTRWAFAPFALLVAVDIALPPSSSGLLANDPLAAVRGLSLASAALLSAAGFLAVARFFFHARLPMGRAVAALLVALQTVLAFIGAEEGSLRADRADARGGEAWTHQAVERLPPSSLVLLRSRPLVFRLWASRLTSGTRPDVTVVPLPMLAHGSLATAALRDEPALLPLLRDVSETGAPSEFALSTLADIRPLFVELDGRWDKRLATHALPEQLWTRFYPQPLGPSDRKAAQSGDTTSFFHVVGAARRNEAAPDEATLEILATQLRTQAVVASNTSDKEALARALSLLASIDRTPPPGDALFALLDPPQREAPRGKRARKLAPSRRHHRGVQSPTEGHCTPLFMCPDQSTQQTMGQCEKRPTM